MCNSLNNQNHNLPAYSGITINITHPTLNAGHCAQGYYPQCHQPQSFNIEQKTPITTSYVEQNTPEYNNYNNKEVILATDRYTEVQKADSYHSIPVNYQNIPKQNYNVPVQNPNELTQNYNVPAQNQNAPAYSNNASAQNDISYNQIPTESIYENKQAVSVTPEQTQDKTNQLNQSNTQQAYPPQYYLNNYNYIQNDGKKASETNSLANSNVSENNELNQISEGDLSTSQKIIDELDSRAEEQKNLEKNGKRTRITALTNEYIMSLENYLNNPNTEIRLMAAKEVLTRLDEDPDRHNDAALNALLNKMLQDPAKLVRVAALSAFSSQLASGNDYSVELLTKIQNDPNGDKEDAIQAANSLLRMSSKTEIKYVPVKEKAKSSNDKELEKSQKKVEELQEQLTKYKEKEIERSLQNQQGK